MILDECVTGAGHHQTGSPATHTIAPAAPHNTRTDPSKAVQNPSGVCQGYETAMAFTLTASSTGQTPDAHPKWVWSDAILGFRQSVVKQTPRTTINVRRCRPPVLPGAAWRKASDAQAMLVPSHACLTFGKGRIKLRWPDCRGAHLRTKSR